jgi:phage-related tail fiber protein
VLAGDVTGSVNTDLGQDVSITTALETTGVTPGTYTKATVDAKGRVTGGDTLSASDIPA